MPPESKSPAHMSTTMYRLEQLERRVEARDAMFTNALKEIMERLSSMDARQLVHMKQTEIAEKSNDKKMDHMSATLEDLGDRVSSQNTEHVKSITGLQVSQTFLEKFGPGGAAGAGVAVLVTGITEVIMKLISSVGGPK